MSDSQTGLKQDTASNSGGQADQPLRKPAKESDRATDTSSERDLKFTTAGEYVEQMYYPGKCPQE